MVIWTLMTCPCQLGYSWDDAKGKRNSDQDLISLYTCPTHAGWTVKEIARENERVMEVLIKAINLDPTVTDSDYSWSFDSKRVLQVDIPKLKQSHKQALQTAVDIDHPGKVKVKV